MIRNSHSVIQQKEAPSEAEVEVYIAWVLREQINMSVELQIQKYLNDKYRNTDQYLKNDYGECSPY